ncbi:MAG: pyridoxal-phosphate dependent enzyme [Synergistaceae bacterium]|jgi:threonine dehydratase|nr:pyridoxal-phosphate dependent enzyme [Synergistaceae bacterium]
MIGIEKVREARERISTAVRRTPLLRAERLDAPLGCEVWLKPENLQITGSFKVRGAMNKILSMSPDERARGVIAASSGNHAQGVAYAARALGIKAVVVMPVHAPLTKVEGAKALGAEVVLCGTTGAERYAKLYELKALHGYSVVHSYDDPELIAGQGTAGLETAEDLPLADTVVVPLGGGGLLAGVALAIKESSPRRVRVVGVEPKGIARYTASRAAGRPVEVETGATLADGLMIAKPGEHTWPLIEKYVDEVATVSDESIKRAMSEVVFKAKLLVEPSAVVGVAAVLEGTVKVNRGERVCFLLSGGNIDSGKLKELS